MRDYAAGFGGCLLWTVFLLMGVAGFAATLRYDTGSARFAGAALVVATGCGIIYAGRWHWFDAVLKLLAGVSGNGPIDTKYEEDYRSQTGVHSGPVVIGGFVVLLGLVLGLVALDWL